MDLNIEVWTDKAEYTAEDHIEVNYRINRYCFLREIKATDESGFIWLFYDSFNKKMYAEKYSKKCEIEHPGVHSGK